MANQHKNPSSIKIKLPLIADYKAHIEAEPSFEEKLLELLEAQLIEKENKSIARRIKNAGFPYLKTLNTFEIDKCPSFKLKDIYDLATCKYIEEKHNVIAVGQTGCGKTHIAIALGVEAINKGYTVKFKKASDLVLEMKDAEEEKLLNKYLKNLNKCQLLIVDEAGYLSFNPKEASLIFQALTDRYETKSTLIITNLEFSKWGDFLTAPSLAAVIIDRLAYKTKFLIMEGSYRLQEAENLL